MLEIRRAAVAGGADDESLVWFDGFFRYLSGIEDSLDEALRMRRYVREYARESMRNHFLRIAWCAYSDATLAPTGKAKEISARVRQFESQWGRLRHTNHPPDDWSEFKNALWQARRFAVLPTGWRQIYRVCHQSPLLMTNENPEI